MACCTGVTLVPIKACSSSPIRVRVTSIATEPDAARVVTTRRAASGSRRPAAAHLWFGELSPLLFFGCVKADPRAPWKPKASLARRGAWPVMAAAAALGMPAALAFDALVGLAARLGNRGNVYRLLARKAD